MNTDSRQFGNCRVLGMTLIEVILYVALLSILMSSSLYYCLGLQEQNYRLFNDIQHAENM